MLLFATVSTVVGESVPAGSELNHRARFHIKAPLLEAKIPSTGNRAVALFWQQGKDALVAKSANTLMIKIFPKHAS